MEQQEVNVKENISPLIQEPIKDTRRKDTIWKFELPFFTGPRFTDVVKFNVPMGSKFVSVDWQGEKIVAWFICHPKKDPVQREEFRLVGTGTEAFRVLSWTHVTTLQRDGLVWHIFRNG